MNVGDVLRDLVRKTTYPGDSDDATYARLDALAAIDGWANGTELPDVDPVVRPDYVIAAQTPAAPLFDYDQLAAAILRQQQTAADVPAEPAEPVAVTGQPSTSTASTPAADAKTTK